MSDYKFEIPGTNHKVVIKAESYEKALERFENIYNPKD